MKLEDVKPTAVIRGIIPDTIITVVNVQWYGPDAADDPGAGKTIMAGLLIKELIARGDLNRCMIVCPGSLAEQWQDELHRRFHLNSIS